MSAYTKHCHPQSTALWVPASSVIFLAMLSGRAATQLVALQVELLYKGLLAILTLEGLLAPMHAYVCLHVLQLGVEPSTEVAGQDLVLPEGLHVADVDLLVSLVPRVLLLAAVGLELLHQFFRILTQDRSSVGRA